MRLVPTGQQSWRRLLGFAALALVLFECAFWIAHADRFTPPETCAAWDEAAKHTLAPLQANTMLASRPLNDAKMHLRRARLNCQAGRVEQARRDYEASNAVSNPSLPHD